MVSVGPSQVLCENVAFPSSVGTLRYKLETLWLFLHSFFYISLFNFLLTLSIISLVALKVYSLIIRQEHFYRDFSIDEEALSRTPLRVAMFTNNYLPFIGGVPLSIDRLVQGLVRSGASVKVFAPAYAQQWSDPEDGSVFRCAALFHTRAANFSVANILSRRIDATFKAFACDLVHVHHPFWLGKKACDLPRETAFRWFSPTTHGLTRMAKEKNLDFLIDGLVKVKNRTYTPFKCLLVGDGPEKERLEAKVDELGMDDRIVFAGNITPR